MPPSFPNSHANANAKSLQNLDDPNVACGHKHHYYNKEKGHILKRRRRSASPDNGFHGGADPFDSYWFHQYQQPLFSPPSLSSSAVFPSSYWGHKSNERFGGPGVTGAGNIGLSFARRNYYEVEDDRDRDTSASQGKRSWASDGPRNREGGRDDGVLLYESTSSLEDEPDTILPFYTKGRKKSRHGKVIKSNWIPNSSERQVGGRSSQNYSSNSWANKYSRKGRRDEDYFGSDYKSQLDAEDKNVFMEKRGHYDVPDANSIYSHEATVSKDENRDRSQKRPAQLTIETAVFVDKDLFKHMTSNFPEDTHGEVWRYIRLQ